MCSPYNTASLKDVKRSTPHFLRLFLYSSFSPYLLICITQNPYIKKKRDNHTFFSDRQIYKNQTQISLDSSRLCTWFEVNIYKVRNKQNRGQLNRTDGLVDSFKTLDIITLPQYSHSFSIVLVVDYYKITRAAHVNSLSGNDAHSRGLILWTTEYKISQ